MTSSKQLRIAVVGLNFGRDFVPIYQLHPDVAEVGIVELDAELLDEVGDEHGVERRLGSFEELLADEGWDAVHLVTPAPLHARQSIEAMRAGLHVACAIPAGKTVEELHELVQTQRETTRNYMMMETAVFTREFFFARDLHERGEFGRIQMLRGAHYQDMEGWPSYWEGFPPMFNGTHALAPLLHLVDARVASVTAAGSGSMNEQRTAQYGNPFPIEMAHYRLEGGEGDGVVAEVTRSLFETAVAFEESFNVYGDRVSFIWGTPAAEERHALVRLGALGAPGEGRSAAVEYPEIPSRPDLLPAELANFTELWHTGPVRHLVHEFVRSTLEGRRPAVDVRRGADWTAPGLVAHASAMQQGAMLEVPRFDDAAAPQP